MSALLRQQQTLLQKQLQVLARIESGMRWSLARLPAVLGADDLSNPAVIERIAALNDRCTKLQDQLAGALRHAHSMLGERYRSYADVVGWAVAQQILASPQAWMELRALHNRLTHDYDLEAEAALEIVAWVRASADTLASIIERFAQLCRQQGLIPPEAGAP